MPHPDGTEQSFLAVKFPVRAADGEIMGLGVVTTDVTASKKAETAVREREELFRAFINNTPAAIAVTDPDGRFIVVNDEFVRRRRETSAKAVLGKGVFDFLPEELAQEADQQDKEVLRTGKTLDVSFELAQPDGSIHYFEAVKFPIRDTAGSISAVGLISMDVTDRKQAEDAKQETARLLQAVLDNSPTAISLKDTAGKLVLVNEQWRRQYGLSDEDALGKSLMELFPYDIAVELQEYDKRVLETGMATEFEMELPGPDGLPETDIVVKFPITGSDGRITGVGSIGTNITERKRAEEALRWSERDLRGILDNMVDTFFRTDREGRIMMISPSVTNLLGVTPEEALGRRFDEFVAAPDTMPNLYDLVATGSDETSGHEIRMIRQDGEEVWVLTTARKFLDEDGEAAGIEGVAHDITMRKRAEEALAESEGRFRDFAEASSDWMWETDAEGRFSYISERIVDVLGLKPGRLLGKTREELAEDGKANVDWQRYRRQIDQRKPFRDFQYDTVDTDGEIRTLRSSGRPRFAEDGTFLGYRGTGNDITESLATERREAETRQRFLDAIETVPVGFALYDVEDRLVLWNRLYESFSSTSVNLRVGVTFDEVLRTSIEGSPIKAAEGREKEWIAERVAHHKNPKGPLVLKRGEKWLQIREHKTPDGSILLIIVDISDIRRAEESLRESERQLRAILDNIPDLAWLKDRDNQIITVNTVFSQSCGLSLGELIGKTDLDIWPPELGKLYFADDQEVVETGNRKRVEEQIQRADGNRIWVETIKAPVLDEHGQVVGTVGTARDITERRNAEQELRKLSTAVEQSPAAIFIMDPEGTIEYANPKFCETTGYSLDEVVGHTPELLRTDYVEPGQFERMWQAITTGQEWRGEMRNRKKSGDHFWTSVAISPITDDNGKITHLLSIAEDTTEKRRMDEQLRHAQKLEAVGTLAGGVAHDFNNLLLPIIGFSELLMQELGPDSPSKEKVNTINKAGQRAKQLTRQLLAFSRKQVLEIEVLDLNEVINGFQKILRRTVREDIAFEILPGDEACPVRADATQLEQVLMNLVVNAQHAMPEGGRLVIETANLEIDEVFARSHADIKPGSYVMLAVTDTGVGMDKEVLSHIFEPFFTTRAKGEGTGLGLATVYGIIKQHNGAVWVYSEVGIGTTFKIYLPRMESVRKSARQAIEAPPLGATNGEVVMIAEDDDLVRNAAGVILRNHGYTVYEADSPDRCFTLLKQHPERLDLLLSDVIMPRLNGAELFRHLRNDFPELRVVFMSGYTDKVIDRYGVLDPGKRFIQKPFTMSNLLKAVREELDAPPKA